MYAIFLIIDSVSWKENENSNSQADKAYNFIEAAHIGNKDYKFNISKQIENDDIKKEKRRQESVNRSNISNSKSKYLNKLFMFLLSKNLN